jgi:hypothetical protein
MDICVNVDALDGAIDFVTSAMTDIEATADLCSLAFKSAESGFETVNSETSKSCYETVSKHLESIKMDLNAARLYCENLRGIISEYKSLAY